MSPNKREEKGFELAFKEIFPIESSNGDVRLEYIGYELHEAEAPLNDELMLSALIPSALNYSAMPLARQQIHQRCVQLGPLVLKNAVFFAAETTSSFLGRYAP